VKASKIIVSLVAITLLLLVVWFTFRSGMAMYSLAVLVMPISIFFMNHQKVLYGGIICTSFSKLTFPGLPSTLYIFHLLILLAIGIHIINVSITKRKNDDHRKIRFFSNLLILNVVIIVFFRGAGLKILGDENWGGMRYVEMCLPMGLIFVNPQFKFTGEEWRKIFIFFVIFSFLPVASEAIFLLSGGVIYQQFYLVNFNMSTLNSIISQEMGHQMVRFQSANKLGPLLLVLASGFFVFRRVNFVSLGMYFMGLILIGLSGHRSGVIDMVLVSFVIGLIYFQKTKLIYLVLVGIFSLFCLVVLYQVADRIPVTFQRVLMILPNIDVSEEAEIDAMVSMDWRLDLWKEAVQELRHHPDYLLIGKGLTYSSSEYKALMYFDFNYWWAILTSNYHQGVLSLLIITGIPGFLITTLIFFQGIKEHTSFQRQLKERTLLISFHLSLLVYTYIIIMKFYFVYGDITSYVPSIIYLFFVLNLLTESVKEADTSKLKAKNSEVLLPV
jgi:hypothetical protein